MTETVAAIVAAHRAGTMTPAQTVARSYQRIRDHNDPAIFISLRDEKDALAEAEALTTKDAAQLPLFGVPVAVKDNIDALGMPTTAACPAFSYMPTHDSTAVAKLRAAGAIIIGKTNLDQFATGLVGVRSPYGIPVNPIRGDLIPGGSSSGSAVAVSAGLVPLALGTDTAGSRPRAGDAQQYRRPEAEPRADLDRRPGAGLPDAGLRFGVLADRRRRHDGAGGDGRARRRRSVFAQPAARRDDGVSRPTSARRAAQRPIDLLRRPAHSEKAYGEALKRWTALGATLVEFDLEPFYETARLLYEGPWVAERYLVIRNLLASSPDSIHPVTREITAAGARLTAADTFAALYRLQALRRIAERTFASSTRWCCRRRRPPIPPRRCWPIRSSSTRRLGTYTNFVNLLDLCGLALPAAMRADGIPFGITLLAPAGHDAQLASIGRVFHADTKLTMGAKGLPQPPLAAFAGGAGGDEIAIAVVGAHLSGMALNGELQALGGRLLEETTTAPDYKLYALDTTPPKPGMLRVERGAGSAIKLELWALSAAAFGKFVAAIPPPLSIGTVRLADGRGVKGFLVEPAAIDGARDISAFGGWRAFMAQKAAE